MLIRDSGLPVAHTWACDALAVWREYGGSPARGKSVMIKIRRPWYEQLKALVRLGIPQQRPGAAFCPDMT